MSLEESILKLETNAITFNGIMDGEPEEVFYSADGKEYKSLSGLYAEVVANAQSLSNLLVCDLGDTSGEVSLDLDTYRVFTGVLTETTTFTFGGEIVTDVLVDLTITLTQDGVGSRSFGFPESVSWENGEFPDVPLTAGTKYLIRLSSTDRATSFLGTISWF